MAKQRQPLIAAAVVALTGGAAVLTAATWYGPPDEPAGEGSDQVVVQRPDRLLLDQPSLEPPEQRDAHTRPAVVDGDTFRLVDGRRVRLLQVDAPEVREGECYADEATHALADLLWRRRLVRLERDGRLDGKDRFGRLLRYVYSRGRNLGLELVKRGAASVWFAGGVRGHQAQRLVTAARRAKRARRGLWGMCPRAQLDPMHGVRSGSGARHG